ncbi:FmdB family zinc ribbon protein [Agrococcus sp. KRD186]|uniref:FmdB family zinc ribbon protein n=1 Tax=Agrococcus sp. KRD186 TaxID=2729730 RepID=UPI0019D17A4D|nr:FmdB family zinc ribbon protein [Agrococcus sp. KRD186]
MPVYAYACTACDHAFDVRQGFHEPALTVCEACGGALRKQFGAIGVSFKGSGFYRTDSRAAAKAGASSTIPGGSSAGKSSGDSSAAKSTSSPQPAAKTSTASSGGAGTVA